MPGMNNTKTTNAPNTPDDDPTVTIKSGIRLTSAMIEYPDGRGFLVQFRSEDGVPEVEISPTRGMQIERPQEVGTGPSVFIRGRAR
jgi:hypothetical protein